MGAFQRKDKGAFKEDMERVFQLFPRLAERRSQKAGTMSGGEQQMCAIGRALMARPTLLMLDEPSMGLAPIFVERIFETIVEVNKQGTSILLVEQNALMALDVANRGYVLETGHVALADDAKALAKNDETSARRTSARPDDLCSVSVSSRRARSGSTAGSRRKPTARAPWPRAISSAAPTPCMGTRPSCRTADASPAPATSTAPSRPSAGWQAFQSRNGSSGCTERPELYASSARASAPPHALHPRAPADRAPRASRGRTFGTAAALDARTGV